MRAIYYALNKDGEPLGEIERLDDAKIQTTGAPEFPTISLTDGISGEFEIEISRKDKKVWGRILQMPKYEITEWMFPRKKKRGSMRRERRTMIALVKIIKISGGTIEDAKEALKEYRRRKREKP